MKFLVFGCNGMAGHTISLYLREQGHTVDGFARIRSRFVPTVIGDAKDIGRVREAVDAGDYDAVINCIGILNDFAERDQEAATYLNAYFPHLLEKLTKDKETVVVHISTDCVFSGTRGGYTEQDFPDGKTFYDRSKALGELKNEKDITIRCSIVGPDMNTKGIGLLNWFLQQKGEVKGYAKVFWTGQTTLQLAKTIEEAVRMQASGLYHMVPAERISKCELLGLFNHCLRKKQIHIERDETFKVDKSLRRTNFEGIDYAVPDYETQIRELGEWMREHRDLYPHYEL